MSIPRRYPRPFIAFLLALALLVPLFALAPPALAADPCVVTSGADSGAGTLRAAADTVANGGCAGTITFAAGVAEVQLSSLLRISRALTIQGPGVGALTLRYTGASSVSGNVVTITGGPTVLRDLTIADGKVAGSFFGGGVRIAPSAANPVAVTLERVRVAGNAAAGSGGGLYATNATLQITDSTIEGNQAGQDGGGVYLSDNTGPVTATLTNTVVAGNTATGDGGGIALGDTTDDTKTFALTLIRSTVGTASQPNTAAHGGGLSGDGSNGNYKATGAVTLTDSTVGGNKATVEGGGIWQQSTTFTLTNSTVAGNSAVTAGGGIRALNFGHLNLTNSTVSGNSGGGIAIRTGSVAKLTAVTLVANQAGTGVAGLDVPGDSTYKPSVTLKQTIVGGNRVGDAQKDCAIGADATFTSLGDNLAGTGCPANGTGDITLTGALATVLDPTLADNGGPQPLPHTLTHNLVPGSPAIDRIPTDRCTLSNDQRGVTRPQGDKCDIGAVEYTAAPPSPSPGPCGTRFGDVPASDPACVAIEALAARGVINGCDSSANPPLFCPNDPTLRHQMAALIVRAIPAWAGETGQPSFTDNTSDTELMTRVATLQRHGVVRGYQDEVCVAQGKTPPCYGPLDTVKYGQVLLFIARALVADNIWTLQQDDRSIFPDQNGAVGADPETDQQTKDHRMVVTYVHYVGAPPDVADVHAPFLRSGVAHGGWGDDSTRAWFARAFWPAIQGH